MKFVRSQSATRAHLFLLVTLFHSWLFSLLSHLFPVSDRFRNTIVIPTPPRPGVFSTRQFRRFRNLRHRIRPPTLFLFHFRKGGEGRSSASPPISSWWIIRRFRNIVFGLFIELSRRFFFRNSRAPLVSGGRFDQRFLYLMFFFFSLPSSSSSSLPFFPFRLPSRGFFHATPFFYFLLTFDSRGAALPSFFIVPRIKFRYDFKPYE